MIKNTSFDLNLNILATILNIIQKNKIKIQQKFMYFKVKEKS